MSQIIRNAMLLASVALLFAGGCAADSTSDLSDVEQVNQSDDASGDGLDGTDQPSDPDVDVDREDDEQASVDVLVIPRSVGGGINEADDFAIERSTLQLRSGQAGQAGSSFEDFDLDRVLAQATDSGEARDGGHHALQFLSDVNRRVHRALHAVKEIESAPLHRLFEGEHHADFSFTTTTGEEVCARISLDPFVVEEGGDAEGGAGLTSDVVGDGEALALRLWINRGCTGQVEDYKRFYASITDVLPDDVELDEDDYSSASAWRAGLGRAWIDAAALLGEDVSYHAQCGWDHTDERLSRTIFAEAGRISDDVVIATAHYEVIRELISDDLHEALICKKLHAHIEFEEHPELAEVDVRLGVCYEPGDEGLAADRLRLEGYFVHVDGTEAVIGEQCLESDRNNDSVECGEQLQPEVVRLDDLQSRDEPIDAENIDLPDQSFQHQPPTSEEVDIVDLNDLNHETPM